MAQKKKLFSQKGPAYATKVTVSYKACATIDVGENLVIEVETNRGLDQFTRGDWLCATKPARAIERVY